MLVGDISRKGGNMTKVIGYVRVSTEEQANSGVSLDAQREKIQGYAKLYDLELVDIVTDDGVSAKTLNRPGMSRVLELLDSGEVTAVLVAKLDRLTRSLKDWQYLIETYFSEKGGCQLLSVSDSIDTRTAAGRLVLNILLSVYQWEREVISERTRESLRHKIRNGERVGAVKYGYRLADDDRTLQEDVYEQGIIQSMRDMRGRGWSLRRIADHLNSYDIPTRNGGKWKHTSVKSVLAHSSQ